MAHTSVGFGADPGAGGQGGLQFMSFDSGSNAYASYAQQPAFGAGPGGGGFGGGFGAPPVHGDVASRYNFDDEPPLLEELGIDLPHIYKKTRAVLNPTRLGRAADLMDDSDVAGPLLFALCIGACHLLTGKVHFGYILGWSTLGFLATYWIVNQLAGAGQQQGIELYRCCSLLGYCVLPMVPFATVSIVIPRGVLLTVLALGTTAWCAHTAAAMLCAVVPALEEQKPLVLVPTALLYSLFALLTVY